MLQRIEGKCKDAQAQWTAAVNIGLAYQTLHEDLAQLDGSKVDLILAIKHLNNHNSALERGAVGKAHRTRIDTYSKKVRVNCYLLVTF